jgi:hypothetical protein
VLSRFPTIGGVYTHRIRDYFIAFLTFTCVAISLNLDATGSLRQQYIMGAIAWTFLFLLLLGEKNEVKIQIVIAVAFATAGEHFASIYMGGYTYRSCLGALRFFPEICQTNRGFRYSDLWRMVCLGNQWLCGAW